MSRSVHISERERPGEAGFTLLEVIIATLIVAVIAVGTLTAFDTADKATASSRAHASAMSCAQQDQERLRSMSEAKLAKAAERGERETREITETCTPTNEAGTEGREGIFTITSWVEWVDDSEGQPVNCSATSASADYLEAHTSVDGPALHEHPVTEQSILTTPQGASVVARVINQAEEPVAGATVTVTRSGTTSTQLTSAYGCALFAAMPDGQVQVTASMAGLVTVDGATSETQTVSIASGVPASLNPFRLAKPGAIKVKFVSSVAPHSAIRGGDTFVALNAEGFTGSFPFDLGGHAGTFASEATITGLYPFEAAKPYTVYAGDCTADDPQSVAPSLSDPSVSVIPGGTAIAEVEETPLTMTVYKGTSQSHEKASEASASITSGCSHVTPNNLTSEETTVHRQSISAGALPYSYIPYGDLQLCISERSSHSNSYYVYNKTLQNTKPEGISLGNIYLESQSTASQGC